MMNDTTASTSEIALITCSYHADYERCIGLCESMDACLGATFSHTIVVPERDRRLFAHLQAGNRRIVSVQDVLPGPFNHLPLLRKWWIDGGLWPVRGWVVQQLTKLSADALTDCEYLMFVDSDIEFIQGFQRERFLRDGALRLHRKPGHRPEGVHLKWHHASADLLGLQRRYFGSDYIAPLATWRRSNLVALKHHIENTQERSWCEVVGRRATVSEYTLYGVFTEHVLGIEASGHFACDDELCHCMWFGSYLEQFVSAAGIEQKPQAVLVQSNIGLEQRDVKRLIGQAREKLAAC
jgi:hypothetical protein